MKKKPLPALSTDAEAQNFVETADLTQFDLSTLTPMRFELKRKDKSVNLRLPEELLSAVRAEAQRRNMPYQRFVRLALEKALQQGKA